MIADIHLPWRSSWTAIASFVPAFAGIAASCFFLRKRKRLKLGVQVSASKSDVISDTVIVTASARKKLPVTPVTAISGTNTTIGVIVEKTSGVVISDSAERTAAM